MINVGTIYAGGSGGVDAGHPNLQGRIVLDRLISPLPLRTSTVPLQTIVGVPLVCVIHSAFPS